MNAASTEHSPQQLSGSGEGIFADALLLLCQEGEQAVQGTAGEIAVEVDRRLPGKGQCAVDLS